MTEVGVIGQSDNIFLKVGCGCADGLGHRSPGTHMISENNISSLAFRYILLDIIPNDHRALSGVSIRLAKDISEQCGAVRPCQASTGIVIRGCGEERGEPERIVYTSSCSRKRFSCTEVGKLIVLVDVSIGMARATPVPNSNHSQRYIKFGSSPLCFTAMPLSPLPTPSAPTHSLFTTKTDSLPALDDLVQLESELRILREEAALRIDKSESGLHTSDVIWRRAKDKTRGLVRDREVKPKDNDRIRVLQPPTRKTLIRNLEVTPVATGPHPKVWATERGISHIRPVHTKSRKSQQRKSESTQTATGKHQIMELAGSSQANPRVAEDFTLPNREIVPSKPSLAALSIFPYLHQTPDEPQSLRPERSTLSRNNSNIPSTASPSTQPDTREDIYAARSAMDSNPLSVMDDFSAARQPPNQTTITTFWTAADPWIKPLGLEDLANLELEGDDIQPYEFVPLGRHYLDRWDDEDTQAFADELGAPSTSNLSAFPASTMPSALNVEPHQSWDPASIGPEDLVRDERSMGIVRARLLAAFLPVPGGVTIGKEDGGGEGDEREKERRTGTGTAGAMGILDFPDLEERLRAEASSEPIIPADDEIASSLRRLQRILRAQSTLNSIRKRILQDRANLALGFSEYRSTLATVDKPIQIAYSKIMRSAAAKPGKKGKNKALLSANILDEKISAGGVPLQLSPELMERVRLRRRFVDTFGAALKADDDGDGGIQPSGHIEMVHFVNPTVLPRRSIYEGAEEEAEKELGWPFKAMVAGVVEPPRDSGVTNGPD
ncbi:Ada3 domain-containing protein [Rhizoctonia solani AG-1 IA]|uniref:Ada3 domain-containing protein n=1 Tax=Thanatephorus cucumeris (strain AG1-IA) TaxID=983506 RepID=L8X5A2_THACA|nr:Ada3 domain-containing protein [Rhizoctonia solani AG-1 IA]